MSQQAKSFSPLTIGLAFFSMFFGSGNLVFPLFLGQYAGSDWPVVLIGFILSGVLGPLLGVVAMVAFRGDNKAFFSVLGPRGALLFVTLLMLVWIPFGAAPRCIRVAYESFVSFAPGIYFWLFSLFYSAVVYYSIVKKSRMIEVLGYFLTPLLLACLAIVWFLGMQGAESPEAPLESTSAIFYTGVTHGYQTMDFIASFFFSLSIISVIQSEGLSTKESLKKTILSGAIGMGVLSIVYLLLVYLSAANGALLQPLAKDQLLPFISTQFLGPALSIFPVAAVMLACLTTSVAMLSVFTDFLVESYMPKREWAKAAALMMGIGGTFFLSLFSFDGLMQLASPILEVSCPLLFLLTLYNLFMRKGFSVLGARS